MKLKIYSFDGNQIIIECKYFKMDDEISGYLNYVDLNDNIMTIYNVSKIETLEESVKK